MQILISHQFAYLDSQDISHPRTSVFQAAGELKTPECVHSWSSTALLLSATSVEVLSTTRHCVSLCRILVLQCPEEAPTSCGLPSMPRWSHVFASMPRWSHAFFPPFAALQLRRSVRDFRQGQRTTQHCRFSLHQKTCEVVDLCLNPACRTRSSPSSEASTPFGKGFLQLSVHLDFPGARPWLPTGVYRHCSQQHLFCSFGPVILKGEP
jgi:hypothetical protein